MSEEIMSAEMAADILCEFFEVAVHSILQIQQIYPSGIFVKKKKYGIPVYMSVHPDLNQYISNCITSLRPLLLKDKVTALAVAFLGPPNEVVQRFVFEIAQINSAFKACSHSMLDIERALRALCLKIATPATELKPLPKGCHFAVQIHTRDALLEGPQMQLVDKNFTWITADTRHSILDDPQIIPLKTVDSSMFKMQLFVEAKESS